MTDVQVRQPVPLRNVPGVELLAAGTWHASTGVVTFTLDDLAEAVAALECPGVRNPVLKLGHNEEDSTSGVRWDGEPAVGWIGNMRVDGAKLVGDYMGMPEWLTVTNDDGFAVLATAYPDRSIEHRRDFRCQVGHTHPSVITAVALLGVYAPGVGVLKSMQDVYAAFTVPLDDDTTRVSLRSETLTDDKRGLRTEIRKLRTTVRLDAGDLREPTEQEKRAGVDFAAAQTSWESAVGELVDDWAEVQDEQYAALSAQIESAVDGDPDKLGELTLDASVGAALLLPRMRELADEAALAQIAEAAGQGVQVDDPGESGTELEDIAAAVAAAMAASTASNAGRTAAQNLGTGDGKAIAAGVIAKLRDLTDRFLRDQIGGALSAAQSIGRFRVLEIAPIGEWYASEINDIRTCAPCKSIDGKRFDTLDEARAAYGSGKYSGCAGGSRCRGQVFATWGTALSAPTGAIGTTVRMSLGGPMPTPPGGTVKATVSVEDISRQYYESAGYSMWITAMHVDPLELIASDDTNGKFYRIPVELKGDKFTFGDAQEVAVVYRDVKTAASAFPHRWSNKSEALLAAGLIETKAGEFVVKAEAAKPGLVEQIQTAADIKQQGGIATSEQAALINAAARTEPTNVPTEPGKAPDGGAAIRKLAEASTKTPDTEPVAGQPDKTEEASVDAAKIREALGLPATASDDEVSAAFAASITPTEPAAVAPVVTPTADALDAMANLTSSGQAALVDKAQLAALIDAAKKGEIAYVQNRRNERDSFLSTAVREGRIPVASLGAYEKLWDVDPEGTRRTVSLLTKNIIPVAANGFAGQEVDLNEADKAYTDMYGAGQRAGV